MAKYDELKRLAEAATPFMWGSLVDASRRPGEVSNSFMKAANPAAVLALIAENEALRSSSGFNEMALLRMGYRQACEERDQLKAELERARADAERYRWLRDADSQVDITFGSPIWDALSYKSMDEAVDAAMNDGERNDG